MGTSGGEHVIEGRECNESVNNCTAGIVEIVGRDCNESVNNCTAGMGEIADKYTEN
jgi:hypothetical protein